MTVLSDRHTYGHHSHPCYLQTARHLSLSPRSVRCIRQYRPAPSWYLRLQCLTHWGSALHHRHCSFLGGMLAQIRTLLSVRSVEHHLPVIYFVSPLRPVTSERKTLVFNFVIDQNTVWTPSYAILTFTISASSSTIPCIWSTNLCYITLVELRPTDASVLRQSTDFQTASVLCRHTLQHWSNPNLTRLYWRYLNYPSFVSSRERRVGTAQTHLFHLSFLPPGSQ